jgi:succinyl-diaminopimelate desuccinylase
MKNLKYDEAWADRTGNVIGLLKGNPSRPALCFTGHMDTVPPGDEKKWEHPPFSGVIAEGYLHGRGAGDMKCSVGTQVYLPVVLREAGVKASAIGDIYVVEVVQEEQGGLGSMYLDEGVKKAIDYAINGEPTSNMIHTGHRGRAELTVSFKGKAAHASRPWQGINPFFDLARFLLDLEHLEMLSYRDMKSTVVPTICKSDTETSNVIPGQCTLTLDWRDVPGESEEKIINKMKSILPESGAVQFVEYDLKTYTGQALHMKRRKAPFSTDPNHPAVQAMVEAVKTTLNREPEVRWWEGATDCGYFADAGIPIVGFGPSDSQYSHTSRERINLDMMKEAVRCFPAIVRNLSQLEKRVQGSKGKKQ